MKAKLLFLLLVSVVMVVILQFLNQDKTLAGPTLPNRTPSPTATPISVSPVEQPGRVNYLPVVVK